MLDMERSALSRQQWAFFFFKSARFLKRLMLKRDFCSDCSADGDHFFVNKSGSPSNKMNFFKKVSNSHTGAQTNKNPLELTSVYPRCSRTITCSRSGGSIFPALTGCAVRLHCYKLLIAADLCLTCGERNRARAAERILRHI